VADDGQQQQRSSEESIAAIDRAIEIVVTADRSAVQP
jgi:hypothetical protein